MNAKAETRTRTRRPGGSLPVRRLLQTFHCVLQRAVHEVCVHLRCGQAGVAERPLHDENIAGPRVEVRGECVAQRVRTEMFDDARRPDPRVQTPGDLPCGQARVPIGQEQRGGVAHAHAAAFGEIAAQQ